MSFSVQVPEARGKQALEWSGSSLNTVFAQRSNLLNPRFLKMLREVLRFNALATRLAESGAEGELMQPLSDFLQQHGFSSEFRDWYFLPMLGCIWSCPTDQMLRFPVATMIRFCHNHGLIRVTDRPQWHTVRGGSREYVRRLLARIPDARLRCPVLALRRLPPDGADTGVWLDTAQGGERFDDVVLAGHSDQSLALLGAGASAAERSVLGAIRTQRNRALLHTDASLMPRRKKAWAAWNYARSASAEQEQSAVCLHYLINRLQPLPWDQPVLVSLNPTREPAPGTIHGEYDYAHPVFDQAAIAAQEKLPQIQGQGHVWFAGAWTRYGFHEDGLCSGLAVADALLARWATWGVAAQTRSAA
jgi:predicted NAD/FAD-binding protein